MSKRYIDANKLDMAFTMLRFNEDGTLRHWDDRPNWCMSGKEVEDLINSIPTADVAERKRGKWLNDPIDACSIAKHCSRCGYTCLGYDSSNGHRFSYCPNCGAAMRERSEDETR